MTWIPLDQVLAVKAVAPQAEELTQEQERFQQQAKRPVPVAERALGASAVNHSLHRWA